MHKEKVINIHQKCLFSNCYVIHCFHPLAHNALFTTYTYYIRDEQKSKTWQTCPKYSWKIEIADHLLNTSYDLLPIMFVFDLLSNDFRVVSAFFEYDEILLLKTWKMSKVFWSYLITFLMLLLLRKMWRRILNTHFCFFGVDICFSDRSEAPLDRGRGDLFYDLWSALDPHFEIHFCLLQDFPIFVQIQFVCMFWNWQLNVERYLKKEELFGSRFFFKIARYKYLLWRSIRKCKIQNFTMSSLEILKNFKISISKFSFSYFTMKTDIYS